MAFFFCYIFLSRYKRIISAIKSNIHISHQLSGTLLQTTFTHTLFSDYIGQFDILNNVARPLSGSGETNASQIGIVKVSVCLIMITGKTWKKSNICEKFSSLHNQLGIKVVGNFRSLRLINYYNTPKTHYIYQVLDFKPKIHNFLPKSFRCCQLLIATENFSPNKLCGHCPGGSTNEHFRGDYFTFIAANILFRELFC